MSEAMENREQTDESLHAERVRTDLELSKKRLAIERSSDADVEEERGAADELLQAARDSADENAEEKASLAVSEERVLTNDALQKERATADERVRWEREERKLALASLLRLEREDTDQHLLIERGSSDEELSTRDIFMAMVSHDLRTMLGGIVLAAQLLPRDVQGLDSKEAVLARGGLIQRLSARMNRLIGDLVDVASIEAGKVVVVPSPGDLRATLEESLELFAPNAAARGITLTLEAGPEPVLALFDQARLAQVMNNLLSNAVKFAPAGSRVLVRAERVGAEARISVIDTGQGIAAENLQAIFGKFWQVGRSDRRGMGLGLFISRSIVDAHGGRIWAESKQPGGSTFWVALPAA